MNTTNNIYLTFDKHYDILTYNEYISNLKYNNIAFKEYISIKPPYYWYIHIDEKYKPVFLKYDILPKADEKWVSEKVNPLTPKETYDLKRKTSTLPQEFYKFISPRIFQEIPSSPYAVIFKYKNKTDFIKISKDYGIKVYLLGKHREYNLAFTFNEYIRNFIFMDQILVEKRKATDFIKQGEFEQTLNFKKLVKVKFINKTVEYPYYEDGIYYPLKKTFNNNG